MKRIAVLLLFSVLLTTNGFAATTGPDAARAAHRQEMKAIKAAQRQAREAKKSDPQNPADKKPGFWDRERERSGLGGSGNKVGAFFKNLNPVPFFKNQQERYNERRAAGK